MKTVRIKRSELTSALESNLKQHRSDLEESLANYRKLCLKKLSDYAKRIRAGENTKIGFFETPPEDHSEDYETVLAMLSMSQDDVIEIEQADFRRYVMDQWEWQEEWKAKSMQYLRRP